MRELRCTLLADGASDRALIPLLHWCLLQSGVQHAISFSWADFSTHGRRPRTLPERLIATLDAFPCDLLFIHRDAEREPLVRRRQEILGALDAVQQQGHLMPPAVPVIPVRMLEAWFQFSETAIRGAAGNMNGTMRLELPRLRDIERLPDPKRTLQQLIYQASGLSGRRLQQLRASPVRVADLIDDFAPLRALSSFQALEAEMRQVVETHGWSRELDEEPL